MLLTDTEVPSLPPYPNIQKIPRFRDFHSWRNEHRKRQAGTPVLIQPSRRLRGGTWASAARVQMRRTAHLPLLTYEFEPGEAIAVATTLPHPFSVRPDLGEPIEEAIKFVAGPLEPIRAHRSQRIKYWTRRAHDHFPETMDIIMGLQDEGLRHYFLRLVRPDTPPAVGNVPHLVLWREVVAASKSRDTSLWESLVNGFRLCGPIEQSHEWPASRLMPAQLFDSGELPYRAGGIRQRVVQKLEKSFKHSDPVHQREIWEKSLEDVAERGMPSVPFKKRARCECILGTPSWIAMPRFPVLQADKVRLVDDESGTGSCANSFSYITEKLQVPTADLVISTIRTLASSYSGKLGAWIVDEKSAFRQLPVAPERRAVAVVALCAPDTGRVAYFVTLIRPPFWSSPPRSIQLQPQSRGAFDHLIGIGISPKISGMITNVDIILGIAFGLRAGVLWVSIGRAPVLSGQQDGTLFCRGIRKSLSWVRSESASFLRPVKTDMAPNIRTLRRVCRQGGGLRVVHRLRFP